jgi:glycosyltransferase involved in cell wall biosynthesis
MKFLILTDIPTQWREPIFDRVYQQLGDSFHVVYCKNNEKRRLWKVAPGRQPKTILPAFTFSLGGKERFFNPGIGRFLLRHRPDVALIFSNIKDPTALLGMGLCRWLGIRLILMSDTWLGRDRNINFLQKLARHAVYKGFGDAFVGVSKQTLQMFKFYNRRLRDEQLFISPLCADNAYFLSRLDKVAVKRDFDVMFSGRIVPEKNVLFFAEVCGRIKQMLGRCRALILGEGADPLKARMRQVLDNHGVEYSFAGFIQHDSLPEYYARAKVFLLPTAGDCWGVVINEAMVAGTPVVTTEWTAAAGELVLHNQNGFVLPLKVDEWSASITRLLRDEDIWRSFSQAARSRVAEYTFDHAAKGILAAWEFLAGREMPRRARPTPADSQSRATARDREALIELADRAFCDLHAYVQRNRYRGYEFDDFLASPLLAAVSRNRLLLQRVFIQAGELLPINLRPLLGIRKLESAKARGFFARGYLIRYLWDQNAQWLQPATECLDWLLAQAAPGYRGLCWGNAFDFSSRGGFIPAGTPTVVWTAHIAEVFELAHHITGKEAFLTALQRCAEFILACLPQYQQPGGCCIGYTPVTTDQSLIHNSNLLGAATLLRSWRHFGGDAAFEVAQAAYRWSLANRNADGSWCYGVGARWQWIDNFHTAYNLECLLAGHAIAGETVVPWKVVEQTAQFWLKHFFTDDGVPAYYADRIYPLDIQCAAQAIETASKLAAYVPEAGKIGDSVLLWTLKNMQKRNGAFRYQRRRFWTNHFESIHWGQATMLSALGTYLHCFGGKAQTSRPNREVLATPGTVPAL